MKKVLLTGIAMCDRYVWNGLLTNQAGQKIDGPGKAVEIDESMFEKRKFNMGCKTKGTWVGGVESKIEIGDWSRTATAEDYFQAKRQCTEQNRVGSSDALKVVQADSGDKANTGLTYEWPDSSTMDAEEQAAWNQWECAVQEAREVVPTAEEDDAGMFMFVVDDRTKETLKIMLHQSLSSSLTLLNA